MCITRYLNSSYRQGCAYVKFSKPSSAFLALEDCDEKYRAVIAEPKVPRDQRERYGFYTEKKLGVVLRNE